MAGSSLQSLQAGDQHGRGGDGSSSPRVLVTLLPASHTTSPCSVRPWTQQSTAAAKSLAPLCGPSKRWSSFLKS